MDPIKEALTFDDVTLAPKYSSILPSEVDTSITLSNNLKLAIRLDLDGVYLPSFNKELNVFQFNLKKKFRNILLSISSCHES